MINAFRGLGLAASLAVVSTVAAFVPQAKAQSPSAYVYVQIQGPAGAVYAYSASPTGQLTAIPGSPFKPGTQIVGSNKSQFFTLGKTTIHSYAVESNGAIGSQLSDIGFLGYSGGSCGGGTCGIGNAVLDHSGQYIYLLLENGGDASCAAYQTYKINSNGTFAFDGDAEENFGQQSSPNALSVDLPSILGNETFAYADESSGHYSSPIGLRRESSGTLETMQFTETDPTLSEGNYNVQYPDASPTGNYVVFQLYPYDSNPPQIGSYTVDSQGNISTTNTSSDMPTSGLEGPSSTFSPDGKLFVLYGDQEAAGGAGNGIEIYSFNGASPLTFYTRLLTGTQIDQVAWDSSNHLYAMSSHTNKVYVFTVTSTSVTQDTELSIGSPFLMVVASPAATSGGGACSAPKSNGVNVCSPANGATVTSPVQINAAATVSGGVYRFELWNGSTKLLSVDNSGIMDQPLSLAAGSYKLTFDAYNTSGTHEYAYRDITVQ
jgi:Bacterial Ig domain